ncbi:uncharacterized protein TM35_000192640 [Trypanosoma theileri]|uniref:Uncharacterized protein n=1 Tax=Trypanosoma theileri TaxID=67003 RepID=A0A1X0NV75_9TRYP|nr:uncharacterized protein TM35_000192640 [Trypanosoma theileri]ORC88020.1 hypothetical protein TM35_000192640 [Trypanosoma theileri]
MCSQKTLRVRRLTMIESAEDVSFWLTRVQEQWCTKDPIAIRVKSGDGVIGSTIPLLFGYHSDKVGWWGMNWDSADTIDQLSREIETSNDLLGEGFAFTVREEPSTLLALDIITITGKVLAIGVLDIRAAFLEEEELQSYCLSLVPESCVVDDETVHAVLKVEVISSKNCREITPISCGIPTSINCGVVEISTTKLFFPSCFLTGSGSFVVSNVICMKNITTDSITIQLALTGSNDCIHMHPPGKVSVEAGKKAYFVITWDVFKKFASKTKEGVPIELHVMIFAEGESVQPITFEMFGQSPGASSSNMAYHYWVNTTLITNRPCSAEDVAMLKTILPVFQVSKSCLVTDLPPNYENIN